MLWMRSHSASSGKHKTDVDVLRFLISERVGAGNQVMLGYSAQMGYDSWIQSTWENRWINLFLNIILYEHLSVSRFLFLKFCVISPITTVPQKRIWSKNVFGNKKYFLASFFHSSPSAWSKLEFIFEVLIPPISAGKMRALYKVRQNVMFRSCLLSLEEWLVSS